MTIGHFGPNILDMHTDSPSSSAIVPSAPDALPVYAHAPGEQPLAHHLYTWACQNAWANLRLHRA
ncbi:MAG: hypothetical protein N2688_16280, partial [Burkholderiaceae bacterium]|nr:hypothetical protein [Burkholderiaceae bacterium]